MLAETINAYTNHRSRAGKLPGGSAPYTSAEDFKISRVNAGTVAKRWDHRLSLECRSRESSTMKSSSRVSNPSAVISLGTARPAPRYYPWQSITIGSTDAHHIREHEDHNNSSTRVSCHKGESAYDLGVVLNYGYGGGSPQVLRFITEHVEMIHQPPYSDWECSLTCGTTSAMEMILRMLCDRGDSILCEEFTYPGMIEAVKGPGLNMINVGIDSIGMLPDQLESVLSTWDDSRGSRPSVIYIIPSGQNPTGATQTVERRRAIYEIAEKYDLIIMEDDPYCFIQLRDSETNGYHELSSETPVEQYVQGLPPSYLSLDKSGRVLRLDATSKILAPGLRCGWLTGCSQLIQRFIDHTDLNTIAPSGPSQLMLYKLLDQTWGHEGFLKWLVYLSSEFSQRLQTLLRACKINLPSTFCKWNSPSAGMFIWIEIDCSQHPAAATTTASPSAFALQIEDSIYVAAREQGVLVSKGSWFAIDKNASAKIHFRMTFAAASDQDIETAVERFAEALHAEFRWKN